MLGDGAQWGLRITYATQPRRAGIADAIRVGADFIDGDRVTLILEETAARMGFLGARS